MSDIEEDIAYKEDFENDDDDKKNIKKESPKKKDEKKLFDSIEGNEDELNKQSIKKIGEIPNTSTA